MREGTTGSPLAVDSWHMVVRVPRRRKDDLDCPIIGESGELGRLTSHREAPEKQPRSRLLRAILAPPPSWRYEVRDAAGTLLATARAGAGPDLFEVSAADGTPIGAVKNLEISAIRTTLAPGLYAPSPESDARPFAVLTPPDASGIEWALEETGSGRAIARFTREARGASEPAEVTHHRAAVERGTEVDTRKLLAFLPVLLENAVQYDLVKHWTPD